MARFSLLDFLEQPFYQSESGAYRMGRRPKGTRLPRPNRPERLKPRQSPNRPKIPKRPGINWPVRPPQKVKRPGINVPVRPPQKVKRPGINMPVQPPPKKGRKRDATHPHKDKVEPTPPSQPNTA